VGLFSSSTSRGKAVKALLYGHGVSAWGHSIVELLDYLKSFEEISEDLYVDAANLIDITYLQDIQTLLNPAIRYVLRRADGRESGKSGEKNN